MAKNLLLEYSEKLACEIATLCNEYKIDSNIVFQIKNPRQAYSLTLPKLNIRKVWLICSPNLK